MLKTEHLPECWAKDPSDPEAWCICEELCACEQRVSGEFLQYDNTPHDVVLSDEPEVGSPQDKIGTERQDHLPECDLSKPCDNGKPHDMNNSGWNRCYRCEAGCICDRLRACEDRVLNAAREAVEEMDLHGCHPYRFPDCNCLGPQVIAAIDALKEGS